MLSQPDLKPTQKAFRLLEANRASPLVYASSDGDGCFFRLADGQTFELTTADCRSIAHAELRWRHLVAA